MRFGFSFPNEHGLIAIWSSTLIFGIIIGMVDGYSNLTYSLIGLVLSLFFSIIIILNYEGIKLLVSSNFKQLTVIPLLSLIVISILLFVYSFSIYSFIFFTILLILVMLWGYVSLHGRKNSYAEMILGSLAISLQFPIIYNTINPVSDLSHFLYIMAVWWIYTGVIIVILINVGCYRGKLKHSMPLFVWIIYMITFIPMFVMRYLEPVALILMIEPTVRGIRQAKNKLTMRDMRKNIKKIGWEMVFALYSFIILVLIFAIFNIQLTKIFDL